MNQLDNQGLKNRFQKQIRQNCAWFFFKYRWENLYIKLQTKQMIGSPMQPLKYTIICPSTVESNKSIYPKRSWSKINWKDQELQESQPRKKVFTGEKEECIDDATNAFSRNWKEKNMEVDTKLNKVCNMEKQEKKVEKYPRKPLNLQSFKSLLPSFLTAKLSQQQETLSIIHKFIDIYLWKIPTLDKKDYFSNVQNTVKAQVEVKLDLQHIKKILFLCPGFYILNKDKNNNIIIGLPFNQGIQIRKQELRKALVEYSSRAQEDKQDDSNRQNMPQSSNIQNKNVKNFKDKEIPQSELTFQKIRDFKSLKAPPKRQLKKTLKGKTKLKVEFLKTIIDYVKQKEITWKKNKSENNICFTDQNLNVSVKKVIKLTSQIYNQKMVRNIFKVNLIEIIQKKNKQLTYSDISRSLLKIQKMGTYLKIIQTKNGQIVQLDEDQVQKIHQKLLSQ